MTDANIGGGDFTRPAMQRAGGERFRTIDGQPRPPSAAANSVSPTANSGSSASASAVGHSKYPLSSLSAVVDKKSRALDKKRRTLFRKTQLKLRKIKDRLDRIDEYEYPPDDPQTEEFRADVSLSNESTATFGMSRGRIPTRINVERPPRNMQNIQAQLDREDSQYSCFTTNSELIKQLGDDTFPLTPSSTSFENDDDTSTSSTSSASVLSKCISALQELNIQNVDTTKQLMSRITEVESQLQSESEAMQAELNQWKEKHSLAEKALQRARSHHAEAIKDPPAQSDDTKDDFYLQQQQNNHLVEKLDHLMYENGQLLAKRQHQEEEERHHKDLLVLVEDLQAEKNENNELISRMREKLVDLKQVHEDCTQSHETQLTSLKEEINQVVLSKEVLNTQLSIEYEEAHQLCKALQQENEEAYRMCEVFRQEIDMLYEASEERSLRVNASYQRTQHHPWHNFNDEEERDSTLDLF
jgi:hypothetical protein